MKEHPFVMPKQLLEAVMGGTKTQHRVLPKFIVPENRLDLIEIVDPSGEVSYRRPPGHALVEEVNKTPGYSTRTVREGLLLRSPFQVGDRLWIREGLVCTPQGWLYQLDRKPIELPADSPLAAQAVSWAHHTDREVCHANHMPRFACRTLLEISSVDVHPIKDMIERHEDCVAEGLTVEQDSIGQVFGWYGRRQKHRTAWCPYSYMFDDLYANGKKLWEQNPMVFAYTFRLVEA